MELSIRIDLDYNEFIYKQNGIRPTLKIAEALEVTAVHSLAGSFATRAPTSLIAPIVSRHHSTTRVAMVGGGTHAIGPGVCSLVQKGGT